MAGQHLAAREVVQENASASKSSRRDSKKHTGSKSDAEDKNIDMVTLGKQMIEEGRKRRESSRISIQNEHAKRIKDSKAKICKIFADRKRQVRKLRASQWERLSALVQKQKEIEERIFTQMNMIEKARYSLAKSLDTVFTGRQEDIEASKETIKG